MFTPDEVASAMIGMKLGTAPGYDNIHPDFLKHLGPSAIAWLARRFTKMVQEQKIPPPKKKKNLATNQSHSIGKPGKETRLASSYRPIFLLSVCLKLLERIILQRISPLHVESLLSAEQTGFHQNRSTT